MKALLWIALGVVLLAAIMAGEGTRSVDGRSQQDEALVVRKDARALYLRTNDGAARAECSIYLHGGYKTMIQGIPADRDLSVDLRAFVSNGSLRFVPGAEPITRVHVICHKPTYRSTVFGFG